jgi:DNA-binding CsgD family transcriptional regulator
VIDPFLVGECFGLSPAESRVAVALARGYTIKEIAQRHRTSVNTVRTQVKNVLDKTRADRQVELVRLVAGIPTFG